MVTKLQAAFTGPFKPKSFEGFQYDLQNAIAKSSPSPVQPYKQVAVLAFHWANDDIGIKDLEKDLLQVFHSVYNFHTESFEIPRLNSTLHCSNRLGSFSSKWAGEDTLRIYVYSGHAEPADAPSSRWYLGGTKSFWNRITGPCVDWHIMRSIIEAAEPQHDSTQDPGDILYIFNSCSAGKPGVYTGPELLASHVLRGITQFGQDPVKSFTEILIKKLRENDGNPKAVAQLYASVFRESGENKTGSMPVHLAHRQKKSITLARLTPPQEGSPTPTPEPITDLISSSPSTHRVLISVEVKEDAAFDPPEGWEWVECLATSFPAGVLSADVTVHSAFSGSTVILLTLPVEVWTMLPDDVDSYRFVSHVVQGSFPTPVPSLELPFRPAVPN